MLLTTYSDMYKATLYGIKKEATSTLKPDAWYMLINSAYEEWFKEKTTGVEFNEKRIEDLRGFIASLSITPFPTPTSNSFPLPANIFRILKREFKIQYVNNVCGLTGVSEWKEAEFKRLDIKWTSYRKAKDDKLYYEIIGNNVNLLTGTSSYGTTMRLKYLKKPQPITNYQQVGPYELSSNNMREIVEIAIRQYLERAKDERYQSFLKEESIRVQNK